MKHSITQERIDEYHIVHPLLDAIYVEMKTFALKKQDGIISKLKVLAINQVLTKAQSFLKGEEFSEFLQILDPDTLPSNSDAVLVLTNYKTALKSFYDKYTTAETTLDWGFGGGSSWNVVNTTKNNSST